MAHYKRISGERVYLSPISADDTETFMRWLNDPEVITTTTFASRIMSLVQEKEAVDTLAKNGNTFSIITLAGDKIIGNCSFFDVNQLDRRAEIGIIIGEKEYWGQGYGTEALTLLTAFGFEHRNYNNICLRVYDFNQRGVGCYEKVGFKRQGTMRETVIRGDKKYDMIYMDMLASEFFVTNK